MNLTVMIWRTGEFPGIAFNFGDVNERNAASFKNVWSNMYSIIRRCNHMLAQVDKVEDMNTREKQTYKSYVHFMRGFALPPTARTLAPYLL